LVGTSTLARACVFLNWPKMAFILLLRLGNIVDFARINVFFVATNL
jgi:hypothetical protein